ncbi:bifunctional Ribosome biogenesis protein Bms1-Tsr1/Ribosome biogenesis protein BMS1-TSR1 [Babesia duncani]|uniref:Bifunctional Ribosome biogenesis protein Bms1-Tsr1/Ribosome biogenesis protein BMS1-TSR1 n=1 Tax=Babesia duncani TaxID=323732 RepID=A0AAD9PME6_9APIC|nr:bifunctional Ribosome biogenesis protein Bms1-Tsr1/Ribosome biogenesis protein BMS1-TSR1 [Babesia duncani]
MKESRTEIYRDCKETAVGEKWVRLTLVNATEQMYAKIQNNPLLILSTILPFERKVSVLNFTVAGTTDGPETIKSKSLAWLYCGFRRFPAKPIFSQEIKVNQGRMGAFNRNFVKHQDAIGSIYGMALAPATPIVALEPFGTFFINLEYTR